MKKYFISVTGVIVLMFLFFYYSSNKEKTQILEFKSIDYIPLFGDNLADSKNYIFGREISIKHDSIGNLFVLDINECKILKYDKDNKLVKTFSRKGQGPGELMRPSSFCLDKEGYLYVTDLLKSTVEVFNSEGEYVSYFKISKCISEISVTALNKDTIYVSTSDDSKLIHVYNIYGKELFAFCDARKEETRRKQIMNNLIYLSADNNQNIWVSFRGKNLIRKYKKNGDLLFEKEFFTPKVKEKIKQGKNNTGNNVFPLFSLNIFNVNGSIFLSSLNQLLEINDKTGQITKVFSLSDEKKEQYFLLANLTYNSITKKYIFSHKFESVLYVITNF